MNEIEFTGSLTGRRFRYEPLRSLPAPGQPGTAMFGHHEGVNVETGEPVYIRTVNDMSHVHAETIERVRHAISVARMTAIADCPSIVRLLDYDDRTIDLGGFADTYDVVTAAWEWGELVLLDKLRGGGYSAAELATEVESGIGAALVCLHNAGLVHSDVAPNNIVRVSGAWKLADLDNTVREGEKTTGLARAPYRLPSADVGGPARREIDEYGLRSVLKSITDGSAS